MLHLQQCLWPKFQCEYIVMAKIGHVKSKSDLSSDESIQVGVSSFLTCGSGPWGRQEIESAALPLYDQRASFDLEPKRQVGVWV